MKHAVYKQLTPIPIGKFFRDDTGEHEWFAANLKFMGYAENFEEAKKLCKLPLMVKHVNDRGEVR